MIVADFTDKRMNHGKFRILKGNTT